MTIDDCFEIGRIIKSVGLLGDVIIHLDIQDPENFTKFKVVFCLHGGSFIPLSVQKWKVNTKRGLIIVTANFQGFETKEEVHILKGSTLFVPNTSLVDLKDDQFYYHEIIGFSVADKKLGVLGVVAEIYEALGNDLFSMNYQGFEVLVPLCKEITLRCDKSKKILHVDLPDGLIEMYTNP